MCAIRAVLTRANTTNSSPTVANTSASQRWPPDRSVVDHDTASKSNMRLATTVPATAPDTWAATIGTTSRPGRWPRAQAPRVTAGLKSAEIVPKIEMMATSTPAVATAF